MNYNGSFKRFEGEIIHLFKSGSTPHEINGEFFRRSGGRPYLAGGAFRIPSTQMIAYILRKAGLLDRTQNLNSKALDTRIRKCFKNERISEVDAEQASDEELLSIPNFGVICLNRVREDQWLRLANLADVVAGESVMAHAGEKAPNAKADRNATIYEAHGRGALQKNLAKTFGISPGRVHQIIHAEDRNRRRRVWRFSHLARPIPLPGPRDCWLRSTLETFDIDAKPRD